MNKKEALEILDKVLAEYRPMPYSELRQLVDSDPIIKEVHIHIGPTYQIEIDVYWDGSPEEDIRVSGAVDDGGWRAFIPLRSDFIKAPDNSFVDE